MTVRARSALLLMALNAGLALLVHSSAPAAPRNSDRQEYEHVGRHGLAANCPWSIYCYRVLVPVALEQLPFDPERRWRWYQRAATAGAGAITSLVTLRISGVGAGALAAVIAQASYGFSFTAYDPYSADPLVFVFAAIIAWCWVEDRWRAALVAGLIGVFAKETVALVSLSCVMAAAINRERATRRAWVVSGVGVFGTLLLFHWVMDAFFGWGVDSNPAAQLSSGSWLALWWRNNPFLLRKLYLLFAPFGVAWFFAALALRDGDARLRRLGFGAAIPFLALCYVQTPERALANAFFAVVPLAAGYLARAPLALALFAAVGNGAVTAKVGSSTPWLPSSRYLIIPALILGAWCVWTIESSRSRLSRADRQMS